MSLSSLAMISILLLVLSLPVLQAKRWGPSRGLLLIYFIRIENINIFVLGRCWGQFEQYRECASTCPNTCDDIRWPNPAKICPAICRMGCDCIYPYVRLNRNPMSPCVPPQNCRF